MYRIVQRCLAAGPQHHVDNAVLLVSALRTPDRSADHHPDRLFLSEMRSSAWRAYWGLGGAAQAAHFSVARQPTGSRPGRSREADIALEKAFEFYLDQGIAVLCPGVRVWVT